MALFMPSKLHVERRYYFYAILLALTAFTYVAALTAIYGTAPDKTEFWKYTGLFLGPTLIAVGWVVTNEVNVRNSRKQHTINLIVQYFTNAKRIEDKDEINKSLPWPQVVAKPDYSDTTDALLRSMSRELNYFDFLASAILRNEIDDALMRRVFQDVIRHWCIQFAPFIAHWRGNNRETWADLIELYQHWKLPTDPAIP